ncbi:MAG: aminoglycoside phosphotransferase family protein [Candidatus Sumerlaeota bacterium]|nr:aminoglycoside phosphotransferase family protein [Candidatus Sumerlaeota bacterium]
MEALPGVMIWEYIDPRRRRFDQDKALSYLRAYGECLGQIHSLPMEWPPQKRSKLYGFIGEEDVEDARFQQLVSWLQSHATARDLRTFVHGDLNTASVLFQDGSVSGVVDWEFAGSGWKEYDLACMLRARTAFLNTSADRDAILCGYRLHSSYDPAVLQWREAFAV